MVLDPLARRVVRAYRGTGLRHYLHVVGRWRSCPFPAVAGRVPDQGRVLDLGCGHGSFALYLSSGSPARTVVGIDVDDAKLAAGAVAAGVLGDTAVEFRPVEPGWRPEPAWDAITVVDVLYLLGREAALELVEAAAGALAPGGVLLVKEIDVTPRWKFRLARLQEIVATRVARVTQGEEIDFVPPEEVATHLAGLGLAVERHRLDARRLHPHHLVVATRPR